MASGRIHRRRGAAAGAGVGLATASGSSSGRSVSTGTSTISGSSRHRRGLGGEQALAVVLLLREGRGHVLGHVLGGARLARARDVSLEVACELRRGRVALRRIVRERLHHDALERFGVAPVELARARYGLRDRRHRGRGVLAPEQAATERHLPQHHAQRPDVGPPIHGPRVADLLGGHVGELSLQLPRTRGIGGALHGARDAEVHDLRDAAVEDEDVLRGHVAVNDVRGPPVLRAQLVRVVQAARRVAHDARRDSRIHAARPGHPPREPFERLAVEVLHREVVGAVGLPEVEHRADVGVIELRREARFVEEHFDEAPVLGDVRMNDLDRDPLREPGFGLELREVDGGHPPRCDAIAQPIAAEGTQRGRIEHRVGAGCRQSPRRRARRSSTHAQRRSKGPFIGRQCTPVPARSLSSHAPSDDRGTSTRSSASVAPGSAARSRGAARAPPVAGASSALLARPSAPAVAKRAPAPAGRSASLRGRLPRTSMDPDVHVAE